MSAEPPPESSQPANADSSTTPAPRGKPMLDTEQELNAPTPLTLRLLGVICVATVLPWIGAKTLCNLRDAPARPPLDLPVDVLSKQPKDAAIELAQRAATGHFKQAAEFAK